MHDMYISIVITSRRRSHPAQGYNLFSGSKISENVNSKFSLSISDYKARLQGNMVKIHGVFA